jgi:hypothetical protein
MSSKIRLDKISLALVAGFLVAIAVSAISIDRVGGLPAHVLFVHGPVVLMPLLCLVTVAAFARPTWRRRYGAWISAFALVVLASTSVAKSAGDPLEAHEHQRIESIYGHDSADAKAQLDLIEEHAQAADQYGTVAVIFTIVLIGAVATDRQFSLRGAAANKSLSAILSALTIFLAVCSLYTVARAGHLGSKAAWHERIMQEQQSAR